MLRSCWLLAIAALTLLLAAACGDDDDALIDGNGSSFPPSPSPGEGGQPVPPMASPGPREPDPSIPPESGQEDMPVQAFNPFVFTAHDPFSTFAADVDSASYDIFYKALEDEGRLPPAEMVRPEEFVNFFRYGYPAVDRRSAHPFDVVLDIGPYPGLRENTHLLKIGIQGVDVLSDRGPANLVFLIDVSGSMSAEDKLPIVQDMLDHALGSLRPDDRIAIVTYSGRVEVALPPTSVAEAATIRGAIASLRGSGSTAGADGLQLAYDQAEAGLIVGGINHILLCTDGDFNVGPYTDEELVRIVEERREGGVTFTALGFGLGNLHDSMMERISNAGNGIYRVMSGRKTAFRYVDGRLISDIAHIAKDVKIQVEMSPDHIYAWRQIGYENRQLEDDEFRDDLVDAGEIGSGHQMTALYELALTEAELPPSDDLDPLPALRTGDPVDGMRELEQGEVLIVKIRYKAPGASSADSAQEMRVVLRVEDLASVALDAESKHAWAVATLAEQLRGNPFEHLGRLQAAREIVDGYAEDTSVDTERRELQRLFVQAQALIQ